MGGDWEEEWIKRERERERGGRQGEEEAEDREQINSVRSKGRFSMPPPSPSNVDSVKGKRRWGNRNCARSVDDVGALHHNGDVADFDFTVSTYRRFRPSGQPAVTGGEANLNFNAPDARVPTGRRTSNGHVDCDRSPRL